MGTRRKSRELVLQMLFQADMGKQTPDEVRRTFWNEHDSTEKDVRGLPKIFFATATDRAAEIDGLIERHAEHWRMDRMAAVDRNVLRSAVAELMGFPRHAARRGDQRSPGNRAQVFQPRIRAIHQWRAGQRGPGTGKGKSVRKSFVIGRSS